MATNRSRGSPAPIRSQDAKRRFLRHCDRRREDAPRRIEECLRLRRVPRLRGGIPIGDCPDCERALVRAGGVVSCLGCENRFGLPDGASVLDERCGCGLPRMTVARGERFELCLSRDCGSLDSVVKKRFDREWDCPECEGSLRVIRRGGLLAGCENYPDCETGYVIPDGIVIGVCGCGLPRFETPRGTRCLDFACERDR